MPRNRRLLAVLACAVPLLVGWGLRPRASAPTVVTLRPDQHFQTIRNFAASDAWSIQFVGEHWPEAKRDRMADLLFSTAEKADGSPVGIGLTAWRFNIGAGSARQGNASGIGDPWRRTQSFMRADGSYDWSQQAGQRAFLREARERGVEQFIGFINSPPLPLTRNGLAHSSGGDAANLDRSRYDELAGFLRDVVIALERNDGVRLGAISPFNEPQWDWTGGQEGTPWTNTEMAEATRVLSRTFAAAGLPTQIEVAEAGKLNYLYETADKPTRGKQVRDFFDPQSANYIGSLPNVARTISGHSYFTTFPDQALRDVRTRVRDEIAAVDPGLEFQMTEYCILVNNSLIRGRGRDLGMDVALYTAGVIHSDLVDANASAWQWWLAVTPYDYKDGLLYIDSDSLDGAVHESKLLWALGHYSRFIRPGMQRIGVEMPTEAATDSTGASLLVSAFRDPTTTRTVVVIVNRGTSAREVTLKAPGSSAFRLYRTTAETGMDLRASGVSVADQPISIPPRSLATLVSLRGDE
jgi:O-glycosyl hydrolase